MKDILLERNKLFRESVELRNCNFKINNMEKRVKVRKQQNEVYNKLQFYNKFIKAKEKVDEKEKDICTIQR
ncbi:MAG: hypothetical protein VZS44_09365 [Bacilli bacterium]|nr:hypothetical protein [Bacilli bacterium]